MDNTCKIVVNYEIDAFLFLQFTRGGTSYVYHSEVEAIARRLDYNFDIVRIYFSHKDITIFEDGVVNEVVTYMFKNPLYEQGLNMYWGVENL